MRTFEDELLYGFWRTCRQRNAQPVRAGVVHPGEDEAFWSQLLARTPGALEEAKRRRAAAEELRDEILGFEVGKRMARLADPRFHSEDLLEVVLDESQALQVAAPDSAAFWAQLGVHLAEILRDKRFLGCDNKIRAGWLYGNALRLERNLEGAERALIAASAHLDDDSAERPLYCRALGLVRWEQHRLVEAASLLEHAICLFSAEDLERDTGLSLLLLGLLYAETSQPIRALKPLLQGWLLAEASPQPWLCLRCGFVLAACLVDLAELSMARAVFEEAMGMYRQIREEGESLRGMRLEGVARARLGELENAEQLLGGVRQKQLSRRDLPELVLTSLELGVVLVELGRPEEIAQLAADVEGKFEPEEGGVFAVEAFESFRGLLQQGRNPRHSAAGAAADFLRLCRLFAVPMDPLPFV